MAMWCAANPGDPPVCERDATRPDRCVHCGTQRTDEELGEPRRAIYTPAGTLHVPLDVMPVGEEEVLVSALVFYREEFCDPERVRASGIIPQGQQLIAEHRRVAFAILQRLVGGDEQLCPERVAARPRLGPCVESITQAGHCTWCKRKLR